MTDAPGPIRTDLQGAVLRITLDRPPVNVLDREALEALADALSDAEAAEGAKVVLLTGAGRAFCAGVDVADHTPDRVEGMMAAFHRAITGLLHVPHPVVAAVHGGALGGGMELALAADVVLLRDDAKLGQPEIRLGVFPPPATVLLPRLIGRQRAADLLLSGRTLSAHEAHDFGLASRVLAEDAFQEEVDAYVNDLASLSGPVLRLTKRVMWEGLERPLPEALRGADRAYLDELMALEDPHEGLAAFMEKREPVWSES